MEENNMLLSHFNLWSELTDIFLGAVVLGAILLVIFSIVYAKSSKNKSVQNYTYSDSTTTGSSNKIVNSAKQIQPHESYSIVYNNSRFNDNLNYKRYECKALFIETNRMRKKIIEAFDKEEAINELKSIGFTEPIILTQIPFDPPTDAQIEACRNHGTTIPYKACKVDVSYIMDKEMEHDSIPNPELIDYANEMKFHLSYYIGKKALYNYLFNKLELLDKIAFFAFCIYRFNSNDRCANLNKSYHKADFYKFANNHIEDKSFINSMNRYEGEQLRYFGKIQIGNMICDGGSKNTISYKEVISFLQTQGMY